MLYQTTTAQGCFCGGKFQGVHSWLLSLHTLVHCHFHFRSKIQPGCIFFPACSCSLDLEGENRQKLRSQRISACPSWASFGSLAIRVVAKSSAKAKCGLKMWRSVYMRETSILANSLHWRVVCIGVQLWTRSCARSTSSHTLFSTQPDSPLGPHSQNVIGALFVYFFRDPGRVIIL